MAAYHDPTTTTAALRTVAQRTEQRRVEAGTVIGTSIEWYDYFLYASAAGLFFTTLFFEPLGPQAATLLAFATVGLSFLFRPLGAFLAGHFGDKFGRKIVLMQSVSSQFFFSEIARVFPLVLRTSRCRLNHLSSFTRRTIPIRSSTTNRFTSPF